MRQRRLWTPEEDRVLKYLKQQEKVKKWSMIAKMMEEQYSMPNRTGKQCRQRYFNHLDAQIKHQQWTEQEEQILWDLHSQYGNRWTLMANKLKGRSQNCIKNHFYSKLRKAARRLNKIIIERLKTQYKQIKTSLLYKILECAEDKFRPGKSTNIEIMDLATSIKNRLFMYESEVLEKIKQYEVAKVLIADILRLQEKLKIQSRYEKNKSGFLDPRSYRTRGMDQSYESQDNFSAYSSTSFNSSFQLSDDQSQILSRSDMSKSSKLGKNSPVLEKKFTREIQFHQYKDKAHNDEEHQKVLRSTWTHLLDSPNKTNKQNKLLGSDLLVRSMSLRPSKSQRSFNIEQKIEDKVSDIQPTKNTKTGPFQKCVSEIAKYEQSEDEFEFDDDFLDIKSNKDNDDFQRFFDEPTPQVQFQLRIFSPKLPSDDGKMDEEEN